MSKSAIKGFLIFFGYVIFHFAGSNLYAYIGAEETAPILEKILGKIGFIFYSANVPFSLFLESIDYRIQSAIAAVIYALLIVYTYKVATEK